MHLTCKIHKLPYELICLNDESLLCRRCEYDNRYHHKH